MTTTGWNNSVIGSPKPIQSTAITTTVTPIYTAPPNGSNIQAGFATAEINGLTITNTTTGDLNVNVYLVPSGGTAGTGNLYFSSLVTKASDVKIFAGLVEVLAAGDTIRVSASAAGLNIRGSVTEVQ